jgi:hypothetical protein
MMGSLAPSLAARAVSALALVAGLLLGGPALHAQGFDAGLLPKDSFVGAVDALDDVDVFLLEALGESQLTIVLAATKPNDLRASITLTDLADDSIVAQVLATKPRVKLVAVAPSTGAYRVEVGSADGSTGPYKLSYKEKLSKAKTKLAADPELAADADFELEFDALQGFELSGKLQRGPKKSPAIPSEPELLRPEGGGAVTLDDKTLKVNKKGDRYSLKRAGLDTTGTWTLASQNTGDAGTLRTRLKLKRTKQKKRKLAEVAGPATLPAPVLDTLPAMTAETSLLVTGSGVTPFGTVRVEGGADELEVSAAADGSFMADVDLSLDAIQTLLVSQLSGAQQSPSTPHEVVQDGSPPTVIIDFPAADAVLGSDSTSVSGRVGDLLSGFTGLAVTVNGLDAEVNVGVGTNGSFSVADVPLTQGAATELLVTASDALGNSAQTSIDVTHEVGNGASLDPVSGDGQTGGVQQSVSAPLVVTLSAPDDSPLVGRPVTFCVVKSDGRLSSVGGAEAVQQITVISDGLGMAAVEWQLGSDAGMGNNRVEVSAPDVPGAVYFSASSTGAAADQIAVGMGNDQAALAGATLPHGLSVWVSDGLNGVDGVSVTFTVGEGSGGLAEIGSGDAPVTQLSVDTDLTGHASLRWTLGDAPGLQTVSADFAGNPGGPATFRATARAQQFASTLFTGLVTDNSQQALGGAQCRITFGDGTEVETTTGLDGRFSFDDLPRAGQAELAVLGQTATELGGQAINGATLTFPELHYEVSIVSGAANSLPTPALLPRLDPTAQVPYDGTADVVLSLPELEGLSFFVDAGTEVRRADGSLATPQDPIALSLSPVHVDDIPMPFADGAAPPFAWTLQPGGTTFDPPLRMEAPNLPGLPAGSVAYFLSFNHDTMRFEIVSNATVSADATTITSDPGQGIAVAGWGGFCPPYPDQGDLCPSDDLDCLLPPEIDILWAESEDEEEDVDDAMSGVASTSAGVSGASGNQALDFLAGFASDGTLACLGTPEQCAQDLKAELDSGYSASAIAQWDLEADATSYKSLLTMAHDAFTALRAHQADVHALAMGIHYPATLADPALAALQAQTTAFDPAAVEAARAQVEADHVALVALLEALAGPGDGGTLQDLDDLLALIVVHTDALRAELDGFDVLAIQAQDLADLLLLRGASVRSGFNLGSADRAGFYVVPNISQSGAPQRVEVVLQAGEVTLYGCSEFVEVIAQQGVNAGPILLSEMPPPTLVSLQAELAGGVNVMDTLEVPVAVETTATFSDGSTPLLAGFDDGLAYSSSNDLVLSLDADGLATAHQAGLAMVSVTREGSVTSFLVTITPGTPTTDVSGVVVDASFTPIVGASVSTNEGGADVSAVDGLFLMADQIASSPTLDVHAESGPLFGFTLDVPLVPGGETSSGIVVIDGDTDGDGLPDWYEDNLLGSDPTQADTDGDGLDDGVEVLQLGTDPTQADSDGDGFDDGTENALGTDPNVPDASTAVMGSLALQGGAPPASGTATIAGAPAGLFETASDGNGDFSFDAWPASLTPVTVVGTAPGGFEGTSGRVATVSGGTTDVGEILLEAIIDPLFLGQKLRVANSPIETVSGDLNGDGRPDLLVSLSSDGGIEVLLSQPGLRFESSDNLSVTSGPRGMALEDLDGDGELDLAVCVGSPNSVQVFFGGGDGTFTHDADYSTGGNSFDVLIFDADGDTEPDLHVLANDSTVGTLLGNGDGTFGAASFTAVGNSPRNMKAGLVNGDAFTDLVVGNIGTNDLSILLGDGAGGFVTLTHNFGTAAAEIALGLFDGDGVTDVIVGSGFNGTTEVLGGLGDGTFVDIGGFDTGGVAWDFQVGDLDGDGLEDLMQVTNSIDEMRVMLSNGDGTFDGPFGYVAGVGINTLVTDDFDADGDLDVVAGNVNTNDLSIYPGLGDGTFDVAPRFETGSGAKTAALGDLDGDGDLDMLVGHGTFQIVQLLLGDGAGGFGAHANVEAFFTSELLELGFVNGDAHLDVVSFKPNSDRVMVYLGAGDGTFGAGVEIHAGSFIAGMTLGNFDAGNTLDVLVTNRSGSTFTVLLGNGDGTFVDSGDVAAGTSPTVIRSGDLDGDGDLDAVVTDVFDDQFLIYLNDGLGAFTPAPVPAIALVNDARDIALTDMDGDGALDIVGSSQSEEVLFVTLGVGDGSFGAVATFDGGINPDEIVARDFSDDGFVDIAVLNLGLAEFTVFLGDGAGGFFDTQVFHAGDKPVVLLSAMIDGDGLPDLLSLNAGDPALVLLRQ